MTAATVPLRVSIVMPCLNEAETVATCVAKARAWLSSSGTDGEVDRKSTRLNSSHIQKSRMPSSA